MAKTIKFTKKANINNSNGNFEVESEEVNFPTDKGEKKVNKIRFSSEVYKDDIKKIVEGNKSFELNYNEKSDVKLTSETQDNSSNSVSFVSTKAADSTDTKLVQDNTSSRSNPQEKNPILLEE